MEQSKLEGTDYIDLHRGGYLIDTPAGYIQFGAPPETIKDTMRMPKGVPNIFVIMDKMFDWIKGISLAEIEFPIYFNYFILKRKTFIFCRESQVAQLKAVLQEALFGPEVLDISKDYDLVYTKSIVPDLRREMNYFRNNLIFSDVISVGLVKDNTFHINGVTVRNDEEGFFQVSHENKLLAKIPDEINYKATISIGERLKEPYKPPLFSITCLGPSHGFDPEENTSGYIIWLNHHGIMVDPPVNSTEWLKESNVNPKLISGIILTHCHADHDAGTFQKILEERKITIFSTETVIMSFLRKYAALSGMDISYLQKLFTFHPIKIGKPEFIHGGKFEMSYSLHSIPTLGFKMKFQDQTFVYTSDHNNDPELHKKLLDDGVISPERYNEFSQFPWDSKVIYHESGVPPLHTPISFLNSLPEETQKRIIVYHIAKKDFPKETSLSLATFGMENTLVFPTRAPYYDKTYQVLNILNQIDFFQDLEIGKAQKFITIVQEECFKKGDFIIQKGTRGDKFYIIYSGNVSVSGEELKQKKVYGTYEYFGEVALITESERTADVIAETDVTAYSIGRDEFLDFIEGTELKQTLLRLAKIRCEDTWNLLSTSPFFNFCSSFQKTWLESIFIPLKKTGSGVLQKEGTAIEFIYIIKDGIVKVSKEGKEIITLKRGDSFSMMLR
ncbi:MAG: cyclic nucleotide-binding domain-containing protein, partial [Spirochaetaceae bacterium]|nr:cyclic nucleotide-binding domain-containing protein [Spirochaetaceae bacterium]